MKTVYAIPFFLILSACGSLQQDLDTLQAQDGNAVANPNSGTNTATNPNAATNANQVVAGSKPADGNAVTSDPNKASADPNTVATDPNAANPNTVASDPNAGTATPPPGNECLPGSGRDSPTYFTQVAIDPNIRYGDYNEGQASIDPGTGDLDYRYGAFIAGVYTQTVDECYRTIKAGVFNAADPNYCGDTWTVDGNPATFVAGVLSWSHNGMQQTVDPNGFGTLVLVDGTVCTLKVSH